MSDEIEAIRRRWSRYGGMGNDRSDEDYTDAGCRLLLRIAWADIDKLLAGRDAVDALFAGGPDTSCRTVWDDGIECVSVPMGELRDALAAVGGSGTPADQPERCKFCGKHSNAHFSHPFIPAPADQGEPK